MKKYFLSICAIVRHEAPYIAEWIEFHKLQGVEHFYIYHNAYANAEKVDDLETYHAIFPYENAGTATVIFLEDFPGQFIAYNDCLQAYGHESEWIAFIDADEFLWSPRWVGYDWDTKEEYPTVSNILKRNFSDPNIAIVAPRWVLFGSSNYERRVHGLVTERFCRRSKDVNPHCKSIVRSELVAAVGENPHTFRVKSSGEGKLVPRIVDERGNNLPKEYAVLPGGSADILRINHYHVKSYQEYVERRKYPTPDKAFLNTNIDESFNAHDCNEIEDTRVRDLYADKIKMKLYNPECKKYVCTGKLNTEPN